MQLTDSGGRVQTPTPYPWLGGIAVSCVFTLIFGIIGGLVGAALGAPLVFALVTADHFGWERISMTTTTMALVGLFLRGLYLVFIGHMLFGCIALILVALAIAYSVYCTQRKPV